MTGMYRGVDIVRGIACFTLCGMSVTAQGSHADSAGQPASGSAIQVLAAEVRSLRLEVTELRIELQERAIPALDRERQTVAAETLGLDAEESRARQQLQIFDQQIAANTLTSDELVQAQQLRKEAGASALDTVQNRRAELAARQTQIQNRIRAETQRSNALLEKAKVLSIVR